MAGTVTARRTILSSLVLAGLICAATAVSNTVLAQTNRYTNALYGVSFEPPPGWVEDRNIGPDVLVQYLGPRRPDGTRSALNLIPQDSLIPLNDDGIRNLETELITDLSEQGLEAVRISDRHRVKVAGLDALQINLTYSFGNVASRLVQVYVPVEQHRRTYLFTFIDVADHFNESAPAGLKAIETFSPAVSAPGTDAAGSAGTAASPSAAGFFTLLVVMIGLVAIGVIIAAVFLLLERREGSRSAGNRASS